MALCQRDLRVAFSLRLKKMDQDSHHLPASIHKQLICSALSRKHTNLYVSSFVEDGCYGSPLKPLLTSYYYKPIPTSSDREKSKASTQVMPTCYCLGLHSCGENIDICPSLGLSHFKGGQDSIVSNSLQNLWANIHQSQRYHSK